MGEGAGAGLGYRQALEDIVPFVRPPAVRINGVSPCTLGPISGKQPERGLFVFQA